MVCVHLMAVKVAQSSPSASDVAAALKNHALTSGSLLLTHTMQSQVSRGVTEASKWNCNSRELRLLLLEVSSK